MKKKPAAKKKPAQATKLPAGKTPPYGHTLGVLLSFDPADKKFYAEKFWFSAPFPQTPKPQPKLEVEQSFSFSMKMMKSTSPRPLDEEEEEEEGDLELGASGWADLYDPPVEIELGRDASEGVDAPGLPNFGARGLAAKYVDLTFEKPAQGSAGKVTYALPGGGGGHVVFPKPPANGKRFGVLITLRYAKRARAKMSFDAQSPGGKKDHLHP
jgi:hypothetical protein